MSEEQSKSINKASKKKYIVIENNIQSSFEDEVMQYLENGWICQGGIFCRGIFYSQAMIFG